jgi:hypothetical protein
MTKIKTRKMIKYWDQITDFEHRAERQTVQIRCAGESSPSKVTFDITGISSAVIHDNRVVITFEAIKAYEFLECLAEDTKIAKLFKPLERGPETGEVQE